MLNKEKTIVKQNRIYELSLMAVEGKAVLKKV